MNDLRKAAKMALKALDAYSWEQVDAATKALRQALAHPDEVLAEREACAKLCDELGEKGYVAEGCAKAIRARSEK